MHNSRISLNNEPIHVEINNYEFKVGVGNNSKLKHFKLLNRDRKSSCEFNEKHLKISKTLTIFLNFKSLRSSSNNKKKTRQQLEHKNNINLNIIFFYVQQDPCQTIFFMLFCHVRLLIKEKKN